MAAAGRAKAGLRKGLLDGVPLSWKDLFDTAGMATEAGSALLKGRVPERDAEVLARATQAGLVCLGKTHMSELAFSGLGLNPVTATPPCVNDPGAVRGDRRRVRRPRWPSGWRRPRSDRTPSVRSGFRRPGTILSG